MAEPLHHGHQGLIRENEQRHGTVGVDPAEFLADRFRHDLRIPIQQDLLALVAPQPAQELAAPPGGSVLTP